MPLGRNHNAIAPVLATVVIGIEEVDPHDLLLVHRNTYQRHGMPANEVGVAVGNGNSRRLRVNHWLIAVEQGMKAGVETTQERIVIAQFSGSNINGDDEITAYPPTVELGIDPAVRIFCAVVAQSPHFPIDPIQVGHKNHGYRVRIQRNVADQSRGRALRSQW